MSAVLVEGPTMVPDGCYWTTMGEIAEVVGGGTPRTNDRANFEEGDVPWVTPADLSGYSEKYISHGARFITRKGLESSAARLLPAGAVLFTSRAPIGYVGQPARLPKPFAYALSANLVLIQPDESQFSPGFAFAVMASPQVSAASEEAKSATTQAAFGIKRIRQLTVELPSLTEQHRIIAEVDRHLSIAREVEVEVDANLKRAQKLRLATLAQLLAPGK